MKNVGDGFGLKYAFDMCLKYGVSNLKSNIENGSKKTVKNSLIGSGSRVIPLNLSHIRESLTKKSNDAFGKMLA